MHPSYSPAKPPRLTVTPVLASRLHASAPYEAGYHAGHLTTQFCCLPRFAIETLDLFACRRPLRGRPPRHPHVSPAQPFCDRNFKPNPIARRRPLRGRPPTPFAYPACAPKSALQLQTANRIPAGARYEAGYHAGHPTVRAFWAALHSLPLEAKKRFLAFTTGCDRAPVGGLKDLVLTIQRGGPDTDRLPTVRTDIRADEVSSCIAIC